MHAMLVALSMLGGCSEPEFRTDYTRAALRTVSAESLSDMREPGPRELVVVINGNAFKGAHAGLFAGARLYDPSGTYTRTRSEDKAWRGPRLADYLAYQLADGPDVRMYRYTLDTFDFDLIQGRISRAGWTMPTDCGKSVRDALAGIGPFDTLKNDGWISPKRLASLLDALDAREQTDPDPMLTAAPEPARIVPQAASGAAIQNTP